MMNAWPAALAAVGVSLALSTPVHAFASAAPGTPPPGSISFRLVSSTGSGCQAGTVNVAGDVGSFTVTYENYSAQAGGTSLPTDRRKNCRVVLEVTVPSEFTYAIPVAEHRGFAELERGASGTLKSGYYYGALHHSAEHRVSGPLFGSWQFTDSSDLPVMDYKPCGENHNIDIDTELRVDLGTSDKAKTSYLVMDDSTPKSNTYHFAWKPCS